MVPKNQKWKHKSLLTDSYPNMRCLFCSPRAIKKPAADINPVKTLEWPYRSLSLG